MNPCIFFFLCCRWVAQYDHQGRVIFSESRLPILIVPPLPDDYEEPSNYPRAAGGGLLARPDSGRMERQSKKQFEVKPGDERQPKYDPLDTTRSRLRDSSRKTKKAPVRPPTPPHNPRAKAARQRPALSSADQRGVNTAREVNIQRKRARKNQTHSRRNIQPEPPSISRVNRGNMHISVVRHCSFIPYSV